MLRSVHPLPVFVLLAIALRWGTFFFPVINHDESTYIVIADELLRGGIYLRDAVDTKPIGIFWIYAGLIKLTGGSIPALRLATSLVCALGAWGLYVASLRATGERMAGYTAGVVYLIALSVFTDYGIAPNTEHYFNTLTIWAVALGVAAPVKRWALAGFLLGLAFIVKPFAAAEAGAIGLYLVWHYRRGIPRMLGNGLLLLACWAVPLVGVLGYYYWLGMLSELYYYGVTVAGAYPIELPWYLRLKYMADYALRYSPFIIAGAGALVHSRPASRRREWLGYLLLQLICVTTVILLTGKRFGHYQIQLHPVLALWVGATVGVAWRAVLTRRWVPWAVAVVAVGIGIAHADYYRRKVDSVSPLVEYLAPRLRPGETFMTYGGIQILHHLLDRRSPIPYVHTSLLFYGHHLRAFGVEEEEMAAQLMAQPDIRFVVGPVGSPDPESAVLRPLLTLFGEPMILAEDGAMQVWERR